MTNRKGLRESEKNHLIFFRYLPEICQRSLKLIHFKQRLIISKIALIFLSVFIARFGPLCIYSSHENKFTLLEFWNHFVSHCVSILCVLVIYQSSLRSFYYLRDFNVTYFSIKVYKRSHKYKLYIRCP